MEALTRSESFDIGKHELTVLLRVTWGSLAREIRFPAASSCRPEGYATVKCARCYRRVMPLLSVLRVKSRRGIITGAPQE